MPRHDPFPTKRFAFALLLAHLAAAYAMGASMLLTAGIANLFEPDTFANGLPSLARVAEGAVCLPLVAFGIAMPAAMLLISYSVVGGLIAWPIVATRCVGPTGAGLVGGGVGLMLGALCLWRAALSDGLATHWIEGALMCQVDAAVTGAVFGWVIWRVAIRPKLGEMRRSAFG